MVGASVGVMVGSMVGKKVGVMVGSAVGIMVGWMLGDWDGTQGPPTGVSKRKAPERSMR